MLTYVLFTVFLTFDGYNIKLEGIYPTMDTCFDARDTVIEKVGRPLVNYQSLCIISTKTEAPEYE